MNRLQALIAVMVWVVISTFGFSAFAVPERPAAARPATSGILTGDAPPQIFDDKNGLPQNTVRHVLMDGKGALWVGTGDGAAFFDGRSWHPVMIPNRTVSNDVMAMATARDGGVWIGTNGGGITKYLDGAWTVHDQASGLPNSLIFTLLETVGDDGRPVLYAGTFGGGLLRFADGKWTTFATLGEGLGDDVVLSLLETRDPDGLSSLWVGTRNAGVFHYRGGKWADLGASRGLPVPYVSSLVASTADGSWRVWAGTFGGGLCRYENDRWQVIRDAGLPSEHVNALATCKGRDGVETLWVATTRGLVFLRGGVWRTFGGRQGVAGSDINSVLNVTASDGFESLWVGTNGSGLGFYPARPWLRVEPPAAMRPERFLVHSFLRSETPAGPEFWFGTATDGVFRSGPDGWHHDDQKSGLPDDRINVVYETRGTDDKPVRWVGTQGGLARFSDNRWSIIRKENGLAHNEVRCILETRNPAGKPVMWFGTYDGLSRLEDGAWRVISKRTGDLPNNGVNCLLETVARDGRRDIWAGTYGGGLARFDGTRWTTFNRTAGLPNNVVLCLASVRSPEGNTILWAGTNGAGAAWRNLDQPDAPWNPVTEATAPGLPNNTVYRIVSDAKQRLYFCTNKGVARLAVDYAPTGKDRPAVESYVFNTEDGLPSNECLIGSGLADGSGVLWVGTSAGAAQLDLATEILDRTPKPLSVGATAPIGTDRLLIHSGDILDYRRSSIGFEYTLMSLFRGMDTRYRTQLVGFEDAPSEWTFDGKREYTNLGAGEYQFNVWGRDYAGNVTGPVVLAFRIRPAPWRTPLAFVFYALGFLGLAYGVFTWRLRIVRRRQDERIRYLRRLLHSTRVINSQLDLETVLETIAEESANLVGGEPGGIGIVSGDSVTFRHLWGNGRWQPCRVSFPLGRGLIGVVAETGLGVTVNDPQMDDILAFPEPFGSRYAYGMIDVPIRSRAGNVVGVLDVRRKPGAVKFTDTDREVIEALTHQAAVAIENASLYGELEEKNLLVVESMKELENLYRKEQDVTSRLQELDRMKTNFISVTSHEMRTPLTVLRGHSEAMPERLFGPLTAAQQHSLEACLSVVDRLTGTFNDLVEILRFDREEIRLMRTSFELGEVVRETVEVVLPHASRRHLGISIQCGEPLMVDADRDKLKLVLSNVIQNAVKFTPDGGNVEIGLIREGELINLTVRDDGIGIEPGELDHIFDRFYTTSDTTRHKSGKFEFATRGSGLGLSIAKSYVEAHGGTIRAESEGLEQGCCIRIRLPLAESKKMPVPAEESREPAPINL